MGEVSREALINSAFVTLADTLIADFDLIDLLHTLVEVCARVLDVQAGGLVLADERGQLELMASTSEKADLVEVMQLNAGSGPCVDCFTSGVAVAVADIQDSGNKWPEFQAAMTSQGFRSVYATPMRLRGEVLGAMNLFGTSPGVLNARDASVAQALSDVATIGILQERGLREKHIVAEQLQHALDSRVLIEQAKGVVSAMGKMDVDQAFAAIRGYARSNNLTLRAVAVGIIDRTLNVLEQGSAAPAAGVLPSRQ